MTGISTKNVGGILRLTRPPSNDWELQNLVHKLWGVWIPAHSCDDKSHTPPLKWFADSFFNREYMCISLGSRGLSGKHTPLRH